MDWMRVIAEVLAREGAASGLSQERIEWVVGRVLRLLRGRFRYIEARPALTERWWPIGYHPAGVEQALLPQEQVAWRALLVEMADWPRHLQLTTLWLIGYYVCADRPFDL